MEVAPKNIKDAMLYIISYYYYDKSDLMPYKKVDIDSDISYKITSDKETLQNTSTAVLVGNSISK